MIIRLVSIIADTGNCGRRNENLIVKFTTKSCTIILNPLI